MNNTKIEVLLATQAHSSILEGPYRGRMASIGFKEGGSSWFKIGHEGERYLHTGGRSLGCMTVIEIGRWMEIYNALIKARKGDFMSVGALEVVD